MYQLSANTIKYIHESCKLILKTSWYDSTVYLKTYHKLNFSLGMLINWIGKMLKDVHT